MRTDPLTGELLPAEAKELLAVFTDPETYRPILEKHPRLRVCLAHFGGAGEWGKYLDRPWDNFKKPDEKSWLAKIRDMIRERRDPNLPEKRYPNLWTDISYTVFADDEYAYMLKVLLAEQAIRDRVLFGSDFYVVADAKLEERRRAVRLRALVGEDVFRQIAETNPREYLGEAALASAPSTPDPSSSP
jgi:predicted TIM-barrel fold metal-dependent hydrolase